MCDENERKLMWMCIGILTICVEEAHDAYGGGRETDPNEQSFREKITNIRKISSQFLPE